MRQNMRKDIRKLIDTDADGKLSQTELETADKLQELQDKMEKSETQARMAWMALVGILIFTAFLFSPYVDVARLDAKLAKPSADVVRGNHQHLDAPFGQVCHV